MKALGFGSCSPAYVFRMLTIPPNNLNFPEGTDTNGDMIPVISRKKQSQLTAMAKSEQNRAPASLRSEGWQHSRIYADMYTFRADPLSVYDKRKPKQPFPVHH